ncbi:uncharacterized protein LOC126260887 [Schistocerca nitens]|uniref:uncharacterized protein LOC126260887 n=1 Tax=Schistocerca nitens TaxID=7011 RepID=UPI0021197B89|nr:uncharacterized protein LOC126260887 [Schistocerca nitens]
MRLSGPTLLLLAVAGVVLLVGDGDAAGCDKAAVQSFNASEYLGVWYEIARFGLAPFEAGAQCVTAEYSLAGDNNVTVHNRMYNTSAGAFNDIIGWAEFDDPNAGEAKLTVHFPGIPVAAPYWVLDTDYKSYSIVWACREPENETSDITETSWILSRNAQLTAEQEQQVNDKLEALGLPRSGYTDTPQDPQQCTVRVSTCDKAAVSQFNAPEYLGVWYEITRFGLAPFEAGAQCVTAEYSLAGDNNVTVHNRMYNTSAGAFNDIIGWAEFDDPNSEEAKLTVHFPSVPVAAPYWVLDTDYKSYSIVWACREPTDETSNITETSWILSRNSELTAEQEQQVNDKLEALGLPRSRYTDTPQDPQQCTVRVSTCDKAAVSQFNAAEYLGVWYEIARFGLAPFEAGAQCVTAEYSLAGDNNVTVHNRMYNTSAGAFNDIIGWAEFDDPNSGEAKLTVHFPDVPVAAPYWVLDTDYKSYSIVWACREPTDETSNITETSWILSRNSELTAEQEQQVNDKLEALGLPRSRYTDTPQDPQQCTVRVSTCDKAAVSQFNAAEYLGVWYEIARFGLAPFEAGAQCVTAEYSLAGDNNVTVHNRMYNTSAGAFNDIIGWAEFDDPNSGEAKLTVHFPDVPVAAPYWVLDTDYESYSIVWACREPASETSNITETSWILSRNAELTPEQEQHVNDKLEALGLPRSRYTDTPQDPQQCTVRVSTCDKAAVSQFNAAEYLGVWYEIARFGLAPFEAGAQCVTAEYSLAGDNNVTVHNRMYNTSAGAFNDIIGWAEFDDPNAGEAKLTVHFPGIPVEAPYWVLDTDYESYSIVWACREPTDETSNITETSWILSRNAQLTPEQEQQVNDKLEALGLPRSRYTDTSQDPQQCTVRVSTCDKAAVSQFNAAEYLGVWYEIARFGLAPFEAGAQCVTAEYSLAGDNNVTVHNRMYNKTAGAFNDIIGWAEFDDPNAGEAKLTVHFPDVPVEAPYWVLDTDYESYSIVWACREPTDETSNITETSWILSRNAELTPEQEQHVNDKLEALGLPRSRYTDTPQDPQQCTVRVSTCDKAAVSQFNAAEYLGVWYEIARFGLAPFEAGAQCVTAEYSLAGDNNVTVHNRMYNTSAGAFNDIIGWAEFDDPNAGEAKLTVHFPDVPVEAPYWVLDTDYESYSIVWACGEPTSETSNITETSWILSRNAQLTPEQEQQVNDKLEALGLPRSRYTDTPQDPQQCTVRVSTCDKAAVSQFNAAEYLGVWYEIARFGLAPFEAGAQCVTAEYSLAGDNNVTVHNRMYNTSAGAFNDIIGWAEFDDPNAGEAKLTVHFPDVPVEAPYWVLDTDYESYSIVWACREPTDETSNITETSWILSRNAELTPEQEQHVNDKLEALGLPRSRYTDTPQDPQQCTVRVSTCDKAAVSQFNAAEYLGVWYEIARFGLAPFEAGAQCVTAEYSLAGDNNVTVHNRMYNTSAGAFNDISGWAEFDDPNSGEAKLTVHFPGIPVEAPYWVLDTDYESYSIVWACREPTSETSNITETSWILSRNAQLTPEQEQQVNDKLEALGLPRSRYTDTPQDPQQCTVRVSTCDKAAVSQFNAAEYLGVWYEIARFGLAPFEAGAQCVTAEYSLAGDNNVTVHNRMYNTSAGAFNDIIGWAEFDDPNAGEAKLTVHFPDVPVEAPYWVLDTDYESYSIVWACREPTDETSNITETSWVLSRTSVMSEELVQQVNAKLEELGLPRSRYTDTPQDPAGCKVDNGSNGDGGAAALGPAIALLLPAAIALLFSV